MAGCIRPSPTPHRLCHPLNKTSLIFVRRPLFTNRRLRPPDFRAARQPSRPWPRKIEVHWPGTASQGIGWEKGQVHQVGLGAARRRSTSMKWWENSRRGGPHQDMQKIMRPLRTWNRARKCWRRWIGNMRRSARRPQAQPKIRGTAAPGQPGCMLLIGHPLRCHPSSSVPQGSWRNQWSWKAGRHLVWRFWWMPGALMRPGRDRTRRFTTLGYRATNRAPV